MQRSDSPARSVPGFWLGDPSAGFRWPFDWTFAAWRVWAALIVPIALLLIFAVPAGVVLTFVAWRFGERARPHIMAMRTKSGSNITARVVAALIIVGAAAIAPTPSWVFPLPWPLALLLAPLVSAYITKKLRPFFDDLNTPVSYWMALLPRIASGPRARRDVAVLVSATERGEPGRPLHDLEYASLTVDPREVIVKTAKIKTPTLQWDQWLPVDERRASATLAWLSSLAFTTEVRDSNTLLITGAAGGVVGVRPGQVLVLMANGGFHAMTMGAFKAEFDVVSE